MDEKRKELYYILDIVQWTLVKTVPTDSFNLKQEEVEILRTGRDCIYKLYRKLEKEYKSK